VTHSVGRFILGFHSLHLPIHLPILLTCYSSPFRSLAHSTLIVVLMIDFHHLNFERYFYHSILIYLLFTIHLTIPYRYLYIAFYYDFFPSAIILFLSSHFTTTYRFPFVHCSGIPPPECSHYIDLRSARCCYSITVHIADFLLILFHFTTILFRACYCHSYILRHDLPHHHHLPDTFVPSSFCSSTWNFPTC